MAVPVPLPAEAEAEAADEEQQAAEMDRMVEWLMDAENLTLVCTTRLGAAISYAEAASATLYEAAELLSEADDAAETLVADVFAVVPPGTDPLLEAAAAAAAKLVASVFAERPLLPGAISAAADLVASVFAFPPPVFGPLHGALRELRLLTHNHWTADFLFGLYAQGLGLGVHPTTVAWSRHYDYAIVHANQAELRLKAAIWEAVAAERAHRLCLQVPSPRRGEMYMSEAKLILRDAFVEVQMAVLQLLRMRDAVAQEEQVLRHVIDHHIGDAP